MLDEIHRRERSEMGGKNDEKMGNIQGGGTNMKFQFNN